MAAVMVTFFLFLSRYAEKGALGKLTVREKITKSREWRMRPFKLLSEILSCTCIELTRISGAKAVRSKLQQRPPPRPASPAPAWCT